MLKFKSNQFDELARHLAVRRHELLRSQVSEDLAETFGRLSKPEQQSRLMVLQQLCASLGFDYIRHGRRLFSLLSAVDTQLGQPADRLSFYAVLTDAERSADTRLQLLEARFGRPA